MGEGRAQGARGHDAAAERAAARCSDAGGAGRAPDDRARSRRDRETESGTWSDPPFEPRRVRQRHPRSVRRRSRHLDDAAAGRFGVRLRQHRGCARRVAGAARALPDRGRQNHVAGDRRSGNTGGRTDVPHPPGRVAGHAHRGAAGRHGRRDPREDDAAARRRVRLLDPPVPHAASSTTISSSSRSTASACTSRRSAATPTSRPI